MNKKTPFDMLDAVTVAHCENVAKYAVQLARILNVNEELVYNASVWHDCGKSAMLDIITKTGKLTDEEFNAIKTHPEISYQLINEMYEGPYKEEVAQIALRHHNRANGTGYPMMAVGAAITKEMQIVQLADVFEALTAKRSYKEPFPVDVAVQMIENGECGYFTDEMKWALRELVK